MQRFSDADQIIRAPLAWAIATVAVASLFAVVVMIANYSRLNGTTPDATLVPPDRYEDVGALIRASGQACARVCAVHQATALSATAALEVDCAPAERPRDCTAPVRLHIAIAPAN